MKKDIRIVIIEDNPADADRLTRELTKGGLCFRSKLVATEADFLKALETYQPDLVLSDHGLPSFDGFAALRLLQEHCPHVPFILISGSYDHGTAVELAEQGAADYIYKGRLIELVPAVKQAIEEAAALEEQPPPAVPVETPEVAPPPPSPATAQTVSLSLCPRCQQLTDRSGEPQRLSNYLLTHREAKVISNLCSRCAYEFFGPSV